MKTSIVNCSRCGENHKDIEIYELTNPIEKTIVEITDDGNCEMVDWIINYWAMCPKLNEPIMITVEVDGE